MVRKQERREKIDEAIIINLIGGVDAPPRLVPKQAPVKSSPEPPPQETGAETCPAIAPTDKKRGRAEKVMNGCSCNPGNTIQRRPAELRPKHTRNYARLFRDSEVRGCQ